MMRRWVQHRHEGREEDNDRQDIDDKAEADFVGIGERPEHEVNAILREADDREHAEAHLVDRHLAPVGIEHEYRDEHLQCESRANDTQVDGFAIRRPQEGDPEDHENPDDTDQLGHESPG